jgi:putative spermidine/putrescine transport system permease protein
MSDLNPPVVEPLVRSSARAGRRWGSHVGRGWVGAVATWLCILLAIAPIVVTAVAAVTVNWNRGPMSGGVTTRWITGGWEEFQPRLVVSLQVAFVALAVDLVLGLPLAWLLARLRLPGMSVVRWFTGLPLTIPGIALGLALIAAHPELQRSGALLVAGHVLVTTPFLLAAVVPVLAQSDLVGLEQVSATLGAGFVRRTLTVTLPQIRTALLNAALMILTLSFGEFNVSYFVVSPAHQTLPVALYSDFIYGGISTAAAQTLLYCAAVVPVAVVIQVLGHAAVKRQDP